MDYRILSIDATQTMDGSPTKSLDERIIAIDFEFKDDTQPPHMVGVYSPDTENQQAWDIDSKNQASILELIDKICSHKEIILGHNLIAHDLRLLGNRYPYLTLLHKPVIDTLLLSPLAFPKWPYHRLVKDYKLVSYSKNRPDDDSRLAYTLFRDEVANLVDKSKVSDEVFSTYANWFIEDDQTGGFQRLFEHMAEQRGHRVAFDRIITQSLLQSIQEKACLEAFEKVFSNPSYNPKAKAFALSWIHDADQFSVLSRWVRLQYAQVPEILEKVRNTDCHQPDCRYCRATFDLESHLKKYFDYSSLRPDQSDIVSKMTAGSDLLAILPTGGGKSLCYQLPALINAERRKLLTIVISPLQALMKDQIDNLKSKGLITAGAIYSGLTPQERKEVLDGVETGKIDIVYVAPEQLRNKNFISRIKQREIGAWIIDEAHCVSKWGHDFRPDYLYIPKIIAKISKDNEVPLPQVACFTATAKKDVIDEIQDIFQNRLGISLQVINKGHERKELEYQTEHVDENAKIEKLIQLIADEPGDVIVYVATISNAEKIADALNNASELQELNKKAAHFHSKVEAEEKKSIQNRFVQEGGDLNIIVATNAFGMGVDKPNVRLVVHYDIPGSLENYLQEAGRAGRDRKKARCILLYSPGDIEKQFDLKTMNRITQKDASEILKGVKRIDEKTRSTGDVTVTAGEILMEENVDTNFEIGEYNTETKVKTALAVLEESGLLSREENDYRVIQLVKASLSLKEVQDKLNSWDLSDYNKQAYETIYNCVLESGPDELINIDTLSVATGLPFKNIIAILKDLDKHGVIKITTNLVVYLNKGVRGDAKTHLQQLLEQQSDLFDLMVSKSPWDQDETFPLDIRLSTSEMQAKWKNMAPDLVRELAVNFRRLGIVDLKRNNRDKFTVKIKTDLDKTRQILTHSGTVSSELLNFIYATLDQVASRASDCQPLSDGQLLAVQDNVAKGSHIRAEFTLEDLDNHLKPFLPDIPDDERTEIINQTLLFLNENGVLRLGRGLAVLRTAMRIKLPKDGKRRQIQFEPLMEYYKEQIFQVHIIEAYAEKSIEAIVKALDFVADYFKMDRTDFRQKHFPDRTKEELERPASQADYHQIVEELNNRTQQEIVESDKQSLLVVAGPGSGKTRSIVHRAAYLLKVKRIKPSGILIVAFNREAINEIKSRLRKLVGGKKAALVDIYTYHGIAMRLAGKAYSPSARISQSEDYFDDILKESVRILEATDEEDMSDWEDRRSKLLQGYSHILVDEYQDIDEPCYRLISAIAGRNASEDTKLNIIAVGDDDQNIYSWKRTPSNVKYIRDFETDYKADRLFLVENYRSTKAIIAASNALISNNSDRIKSSGRNEVRIDTARQNEPIGGRWESLDASGDKGRVVIYDIATAKDQGGVIADEIERRRNLDNALKFSEIAILTRTNDEADFICEAYKRLTPTIPTRRPSPTGIPFPMYREVALTTESLEVKSSEIALAKDIVDSLYPSLKAASGQIWQYRVLIDLLKDFVGFNGRSSISVDDWIQYLWDYAATQKGQIPDLDAVLVTTIHQAKGKEFKHVFLLDPGDVGQSNKPGQSMEDERRLFYVGLTRAMELASVFKVSGSKTPFADELFKADGYVVRRNSKVGSRWSQVTQAIPESMKVIQFGLSDIWAASFAREQSKWFDRDKVQNLLEKIPIGEPLELRCSTYIPGNNGICAVEIFHEDLKLGNLSQATAEQYQVTDGLKVEVGAVIRCRKTDEDKFATLDRYYALLPRVIKT